MSTISDGNYNNGVQGDERESVPVQVPVPRPAAAGLVDTGDEDDLEVGGGGAGPRQADDGDDDDETAPSPSRTGRHALVPLPPAATAAAAAAAVSTADGATAAPADGAVGSTASTAIPPSPPERERNNDDAHSTTGPNAADPTAAHTLHEGGEDDTTDADAATTTTTTRRERCLRLVCWPVGFAVSLATVAAVVTFCLLPAAIVVLVSLARYYCCTANPVPLRLLLRAMLGSDDDGNNIHLHTDWTHGGPPAMAPRPTTAEIHAALLRRTCTAVTAVAGPDSKAEAAEEEKMPQQHPQLSYAVVTEHGVLCFSDPLDDDDDDDDGDDNDNIGKNGASSRSATVLWDGAANFDDEEQPPPPPAASALSATATNGGGDDGGAAEEEARRGTAAAASCDICLLPVTAGDVVAWSHNPACAHSYHVDCVTDWLRKSNSCPNCRADYLYLSHRPRRPSRLKARGGGVAAAVVHT